MCYCVEEAMLEKARFSDNLVEFIRVINSHIRDLHLEIRRAVDEFTGDYYYVLVKYIYGYSSSQSNLPHCYGNSHAIWDLPPDRADIPTFTPAKAGTGLSDPGGMQGWVDLVGWLHTEMVYSPEDGHPSQY